MNSLLEFFSFSDPNVRYVVIGSVLLLCSSAIVGCFTFLRKRSLVGDAVAHSVLPGICLAFIIIENKNPFILLIGAFITGWLSLVAIDYIRDHSRIKEDAAIGLTLSVFFGIGILLLTAIQSGNYGQQAGLSSFLFGNAAALIGEDLWVFGGVAVLLIGMVGLFYKELLLISFDEDYAKSMGLPVRGLKLLLTTLTVLAVVVGIQAVGVVLMSAMLITPAAAARYWTDRLPVMILLAMAFGAFSGISGAYVSYIAPGMPTGPWIVVVVSVIAILSLLFAPNRGILARVRLQRSNRRKINEENILKLFYHLGEKEKNFDGARTIDQILERRKLALSQLKTGLRRLSRSGKLQKQGEAWFLTQRGVEEGKRITRIHRLWELYLSTYLSLPSDHVHEGAETIEHVITPELERMLAAELDHPGVDPHESEIPY